MRVLISVATVVGVGSLRSGALVRADSPDDHYRARHLGAWPEWNRDWEHSWMKDQEGKAVDKSTSQHRGKKRHIILLRHGQYNLDSPENELTDRGRVQAKITGERLRTILTEPVDDKYGRRQLTLTQFVHSGVTRARETAEIIALELGPTAEAKLLEDPILAEAFPCIPEPLSRWNHVSTDDVAAHRIEAAFHKYIAAEPESSDGVSAINGARAEGTHEQTKLSVDEDCAVIVCHGNVIKYFVLRALQLPPEYWMRLSADNCSLAHLIIQENGRVSLSKFGDTGHLNPSLITFH
jgi:serine/threonine-protein phosphatase PGAM5